MVTITNQKVRPISLIQDDGPWTIDGASPAATIWESLNEVTADAFITYVYSPQNPTTNDDFTVKLDTPDDPIKRSHHVLRIQAAASSLLETGDPPRVQIRLYQGGTLIATSTRFQLGWFVWATYEFEIDTADAENITDYSDLRVQVNPYQSATNAADRVLVSWIELEVPSTLPTGCFGPNFDVNFEVCVTDAGDTGGGSAGGKKKKKKPEPVPPKRKLILRGILENKASFSRGVKAVLYVRASFSRGLIKEINQYASYSKPVRSEKLNISVGFKKYLGKRLENKAAFRRVLSHRIQHNAEKDPIPIYELLIQYKNLKIDMLEKKPRFEWFEADFDAFTSSSSFVGNVLYDNDTQGMVILLNGKEYYFCRVPKRVFDSFKGSSSPGAFFNRSIKGQYDC